MLGDNITFTPIDSRGKWDRDIQEGKEALQMCVYGWCEIQLDGSQGPKPYLVQNHHAFTIGVKFKEVFPPYYIFKVSISSLCLKGLKCRMLRVRHKTSCGCFPW